MEITQKGKEHVSSAEFRRNLRTTVAKLHAENLPDEIVIALIANMIGWVLTGHEISQPPDAEIAIELQEFVDGHVEEIKAIADDGLRE